MPLPRGPKERIKRSTNLPPGVDPAIIDGPKRKPTGRSVLEEGSIQEYGRTYHSYKEGTYLLPNDGDEQDRLDMQHEAITTLLDGKLAWAPINKPKRVLDIATGTGIWAIQFARKNPESIVIGTDLSLIQPRNVVPNVQFFKEDAEDDLWTHDEQFDYIHMRMIFTCFDDLGKILLNAYKYLKPGGWVELQDHTPEVFSSDGTSIGSAFEKFGIHVMKGLAKIGRDATRIKYADEMLQMSGFLDIQQHVLPYPVGGWPEDRKNCRIGNFTAANVSKGLEASVKMLIAGGLSQLQADDLMYEARCDLRRGKIHGYMPFYVVYGRKPFRDEAWRPWQEGI